MDFVIYIGMFAFGWFIGSRRMSRLQHDFTQLEYVIRKAQASLINGFPAEARDHLRSVLPENPGPHTQTAILQPK